MSDHDKVEQWLYEDGNKPFSVQPEQHLFNVIMKVTETEDPILIIHELEDVGMHKDTIERFKDHFIAKHTEDGTLRKVLFEGG